MIFQPFYQTRYLIKIQLYTSSNNHVFILHCISFCSNYFILLGVYFSDCVVQPQSIFRQNIFHWFVRLVQFLHSTTNQREHWLIIVPIGWINDDDSVLPKSGCILGSYATPSCSTTHNQQFTTVLVLQSC